MFILRGLRNSLSLDLNFVYINFVDDSVPKMFIKAEKNGYIVGRYFCGFFSYHT